MKVLADDDTKVQLTTEVGDLKTAAEVSKGLDEKLAWLDGFNKNIVDYDKICKELEEIVSKDRKDLDALIKPEGAFKVKLYMPPPFLIIFILTTTLYDYLLI